MSIFISDSSDYCQNYLPRNYIDTFNKQTLPQHLLNTTSICKLNILTGGRSCTTSPPASTCSPPSTSSSSPAEPCSPSTPKCTRRDVHFFGETQVKIVKHDIKYKRKEINKSYVSRSMWKMCRQCRYIFKQYPKYLQNKFALIINLSPPSIIYSFYDYIYLTLFCA